ncbi:MAG: histone deacetylase [Planctomycetota bacterium]|nr:MAG: histone deacetylase [Planctomycetota bacterium]
MSTAYLWHPVSLEHDTGVHVETIARADRMNPANMRRLVPDLNVRPVEKHDTVEWILTVHERAYHDFVSDACIARHRLLDEGDTVICERSYDAALASVDAALTAADLVMSGECRTAFSAMRPPGHHALPGRAMGFCLFSNISILARYLQRRHGIGQIAIVDWDVHHGNGTQAIFYDDPSVFFVSLHQHPLWPGSGMRHERGEGPGMGYTLNIPIPPATPEAEYLARFDAEVLPALRKFAPEFILISAGFDAHRDDPLANLMLTESAFATLTDRVSEVAAETAGGRVISVLEGGYNLAALEKSTAAHIMALGR